MMSERPSANGDEASITLEERAVTQHALAEILLEVRKLDQRLHVVDTIARDCADNTFRMLQRTDPLTWPKRALIFGLGSLVGSAVGAAIVHTIALAYLR